MLHTHDVQWYRCPDCGFMCTESPYWLDEAYSDTMTRSDVGAVARNIQNVPTAAAIISLFFQRDASHLDWGGGYGLFTRMMRDMGYDFFCHDPHAANLFARGFSLADAGKDRFDLATAFEVFEHFVDPSSEVHEILLHASSILFTTTVVPLNPPRLTEWWYYGLDHGQHVSIHTRQSLQRLASKHGLALYSCGESLHLMTQRRLPLPGFSLACRIARRLPLSLIRGPRGALIDHDYRKMVGQQSA